MHESPMRSDIEIGDPPFDISWDRPHDEWLVVYTTVQLIDFGDDLVWHNFFVSFPVIAVPDASRSTIESAV